MALTVKWSKEAKANYENIIVYLKKNWSNKEVIAFTHRTSMVVKIISHQPYLYQSKYKNIRKAVIGKQNSLFYLVKESEIYLLSIWDNRQDPAKSKF